MKSWAIQQEKVGHFLAKKKKKPPRTPLNEWAYNGRIKPEYSLKQGKVPKTIKIITTMKKLRCDSQPSSG